MFKRIDAEGPEVIFTFEGQTILAQQGDSIAAALLLAGQVALRETPVSGVARGPFCMMGACFDCLVQIDGVIVQACMTPVQAGLVVRRAPAVQPRGTAP